MLLACLAGCSQRAREPKSGAPAAAPDSAPTAVQDSASERALDRAVRTALASERDLAVDTRYQALTIRLSDDAVLDGLVLVGEVSTDAEHRLALLVFKGGEHGFELQSRVGSLRPPIRIGADVTRGWHDLIVRTVARDGTVKDVVMHFDGFTYPPNAARMPALRASGDAGARVVFGE